MKRVLYALVPEMEKSFSFVCGKLIKRHYHAPGADYYESELEIKDFGEITDTIHDFFKENFPSKISLGRFPLNAGVFGFLRSYVGVDLISPPFLATLTLRAERKSVTYEGNADSGIWSATFDLIADVVVKTFYNKEFLFYVNSYGPEPDYFSDDTGIPGHLPSPQEYLSPPSSTPIYSFSIFFPSNISFNYTTVSVKVNLDECGRNVLEVEIGNPEMKIDRVVYSFTETWFTYLPNGGVRAGKYTTIYSLAYLRSIPLTIPANLMPLLEKQVRLFNKALKNTEKLPCPKSGNRGVIFPA